MGRKIVLIGWDACDPALAQRFAAQGLMPNFAQLLETGARAPVANPHGLFVGSLWVNFATGVRPGTHGFHCWDKVDLATYQYEMSPPRVAHIPQFWIGMGEAGLRVAAVDVPHMKANFPVNGVHIVEWGCHDKHFGFHTWPADLAKTIEAQFGFHPALKGREAYEVRDCAPDDEIHRAGLYRTKDEDCALLRDMLAGLQTKKDLVLSVLKQEPWDFFVAVFGESHAIGHQQWHLHDPKHPRYDPDVVAALGGDPIAQVYSALDRALGEILAVADADLFMLHLSHGMGPHYDGTHLLEDILIRLEEHYAARETGARPTVTPLIKRVMKPFVPALQAIARAVGVPAGLRKRLGGAVVTWETDSRAQRRYFMEPNNTVYGGVRLNLVGREPKGRVLPEDAEDVIAQLEQDLLEVINVDTGKPLIREVQRCDAWHQRAPTDVMPDLFLDWDRSTPVERVTSPKIGELHRPYEHWRTGDHRPAGMIVARGEGMPAGERLPGLAVEDIGPSLAARLGVALRDVEGAPCAWLARRESAPEKMPA